MFPFDSFVYVRSRDGWHAGETIDTCPACETFLLFDDSYAVTPPRLRLPHLRPSERERERNFHPFSRPTPSPTCPSLIVQNSICPFATLISRSRGQGGSSREVGEHSKWGGGFIGVVREIWDVRVHEGRMNWMRGEEEGFFSYFGVSLRWCSFMEC